MDQSSSNQITESHNLNLENFSSQTEMPSQIAADSQTEITHMDADLYKALCEGDISFLEIKNSEAYLQLQRTPIKNTVLHVAAQFGQPACVGLILLFPSCSSLLRQPNLKGDTPLHLAAREGNSRVVEALIQAAKPSSEEIESGVKSDHKEMMRMMNSENNTALHEAVRYHHTEVVKLLIKEDPEYPYGANITGNTPLYMAAERGFDDLVEIIIDNTRTSPAHTGVEGRTALHAAVICGHPEMTRKILDWKPDLAKEVDHEGWSPLHCAAYLGHITIVTLLLEKSSDRSEIYLQTKNGKKTALHIAAIRGYLGIVQLLISSSPDCCEQVDDSGRNVLHFFILNPKDNPIQLELRNNLNMRGLVNEKDSEGNTPLHLLATYQLNRGNFISNSKVDKMAFNNTKLTAKDILLLSEEDLCGEKDKILRKLQKAKASAGPLGWKNAAEISDPSGKGICEMKKTGEVHLIVATLIATVTFAAGFTLPGGYNDDDGQAILAKKAALKAFIVTDTLAMVLSLSAVLVYFFLALHETKDMVVKHLLSGFFLVIIAMGAMVVAFVTGLYAVLPFSSGLPIATCVIGCCFFTSFYFLFRQIYR